VRNTSLIVLGGGWYLVVVEILYGVDLYVYKYAIFALNKKGQEARSSANPFQNQESALFALRERRQKIK
jgi:hypothetical protein